MCALPILQAAMRAVVRISAWAYQRFIDVECCIAQRAVQAVVPLSAGAARCFQVTFRIGPITIKATEHGPNGKPETPISAIRRGACCRESPSGRGCLEYPHPGTGFTRLHPGSLLAQPHHIRVGARPTPPVS